MLIEEFLHTSIFNQKRQVTIRLIRGHVLCNDHDIIRLLFFSVHLKEKKWKLIEFFFFSSRNQTYEWSAYTSFFYVKKKELIISLL